MNLLSPRTQFHVEELVDQFKRDGAVVLIVSTDLAADEARLLVVPPNEPAFHVRVSDRLRRDVVPG